MKGCDLGLLLELGAVVAEHAFALVRERYCEFRCWTCGKTITRTFSGIVDTDMRMRGWTGAFDMLKESNVIPCVDCINKGAF